MRISKVKVDGNRVEIHRAAVSSRLVFSEKGDTDQTDLILPGKKRANFDLSIRNQTLTKRGGDGKLYGELNALLNQLLSNDKKRGKPLNVASVDALRKCLKEKFCQPFTYRDGDVDKTFCLFDLLMRYSGEGDISVLKPYREWVEWYIDNKSNLLKCSIRKNTILCDSSSTPKKEGMSNRKIKLEEFARKYANKETINVDDCHTKYDISGLVIGFAEVIGGMTYEGNEYQVHRELKRCLQSHQKKIFGTRGNENCDNRDKLAVYHQEVVKYLEHYFPIKRTSRKNQSENTVKYLLRESTIKVRIEKQLNNAVRQYLISRGKAKVFEFKGDETSDRLSEIKRDDAFLRSLIGVCSFAAGNVRNIIDSEQTSDLLSCEFLEPSLEKGNMNTDLFRMFFPSVSVSPSAKDWWALRGAVQTVRNSLFHFKKDSFQSIFNIETYEYPKGMNVTYKDNALFSSLLSDEIKKVNELFKEQLQLNKLFCYYSEEDIQRLFTHCRFSLCRSSVPFLPSFKRVFSQGCDYQHAGKEGGKPSYDLNLSFYHPQIARGASVGIEEEESYQTRRFMLKLVYNHSFLQTFLSDRKWFKESVTYVLNLNKEHNRKRKNHNQMAFKEIRPIEIKETPESYLAYIQSELVVEELSKGDEEGKRINFEKFIIQLFVKAFDDFLSKNDLSFINQPKKREGATSEVTLHIDHKLNSREDQSHLIAFFIFCKLLDANHLSLLRNELIKYRATLGQEGHKFILSPHLEVIELCLLTVDRMDSSVRIGYDDISPFIEGRLESTRSDGSADSLKEYYKEGKSETLIPYGNIHLCMKYGTIRLLSSVTANFKITWRDYSRWRELKSSIGKEMAQRAELHRSWVNSGLLDSERIEYQALCNRIDEYNWLDNKIHFVHLKKLNSLLIELLGRMVGFTSLLERDFKLFHWGRSTIINGNQSAYNEKKPRFKDITKESYDKQFVFVEGINVLRNHIAHFNYITTNAGEYSLLELINNLRSMMEYDRKLKNAVVKSMVDIFEKHGMVLKMKFNADHLLEIDSIHSKQITHIPPKKSKQGKGKQRHHKIMVKTNQVSEEYCRLCKALLEMKNWNNVAKNGKK